MAMWPQADALELRPGRATGWVVAEPADEGARRGICSGLIGD
mgnify:FL=1